MGALQNCVNESAILATKDEYLSPFLLGYQIEQLNGLILDSTKQQIKELVNENSLVKSKTAKSLPTHKVISPTFAKDRIFPTPKILRQ